VARPFVSWVKDGRRPLPSLGQLHRAASSTRPFSWGTGLRWWPGWRVHSASAAAAADCFAPVVVAGWGNLEVAVASTPARAG